MELSLAADNLATRYDDLRQGRLPPAHTFDREAVAILFELALGLSAWKSYGGNRWALRCNPSSGNLHPTEGYLLWPGSGGLAAGLYHYVSRDHALERRAAIASAWADAGGFIVGLSSIYWREAWKYGMRAWRYCQHDCGHAIASVSYAAAALGWQARILDCADQDIAALLGLDRGADFEGAEDEAPDVLLWIGDPSRRPHRERLREWMAHADWAGRANALSDAHVQWPDIDDVHHATVKRQPREGGDRRSRGNGNPAGNAHAPWLDSRVRGNDVPPVDLRFAAIARQRRSAVDFDGETSIDAQAFFAMLACLLPCPGTPPWNVLEIRPEVHPALMVHRVRGLEPGLYVLVRDDSALESLRAAMRSEWLWQKAGPDSLPLYFLLPHDLRAAARMICCHQDIAADSCFALGMLAHFEATAGEPWRYRELFHECGMLGHVLYLEAEAAGIRATGIGCFFDDEMHALLGLRDRTWQSLYHFTAGGPVEDRRLSTLPPYEKADRYLFAEPKR